MVLDIVKITLPRSYQYMKRGGKDVLFSKINRNFVIINPQNLNGSSKYIHFAKANLVVSPNI